MVWETFSAPAEACDPQHFLGCLRFVRRGGLWRHDLVKHFIYRTCKEVGWYAEEEVPLLRRRVANQDGAVMDILVYAPWGTSAIDASGTCPAAPSYRGRACQRKMAAASERVAAKNAMYVATCRDLGMIFTPAVFETTGALHPTLHDLMKRLTDAMVERFPLRETTNACSARLRAELNGAIHAGNATVIRQGLLDARAANLRGARRAEVQPRRPHGWVSNASWRRGRRPYRGGWRAPASSASTSSSAAQPSPTDIATLLAEGREAAARNGGPAVA